MAGMPWRRRRFVMGRHLVAASLALTITTVMAAPTIAAPPAGRGVDSGLKSGTVTVKGGELYYEIRGSGPTVVLLHAGLLDRRMWDEQFATFSHQFRVIRYDARGHGRSSMPTGELCNYEDLHDLLVGLHVEHAALVGLSLGARTAIDFALTYPKMVDGLVLVSPSISGWQFNDPVLKDYEKHMREAGAKGDLDTYLEYFQRAWTDGPRRRASEVDPRLRSWVAIMAKQNLSRLASGGDVKVIELNALHKIQAITAPTLVIAGTLDVTDVLSMTELLSSTIAGAHKEFIAGAGHLVNLEKPAEFDRIVLGFLQELRLRPAAKP
jgi:3-oxoadipate enol-lactonase